MVDEIKADASQRVQAVAPSPESEVIDGDSTQRILAVVPEKVLVDLEGG